MALALPIVCRAMTEAQHFRESQGLPAYPFMGATMNRDNSRGNAIAMG
jgi:hypothetical protein